MFSLLVAAAARVEARFTAFTDKMINDGTVANGTSVDGLVAELKVIDGTMTKQRVLTKLLQFYQSIYDEAVANGGAAKLDLSVCCFFVFLFFLCFCFFS